MSLVLQSLDLIDVPVAQPILLLLLALLLVAAYTDLRERRISNLLTITAAVLAIAAHSLSAGVSGLLASLLSYTLWLGIGFFLYAVVLTQGVGAGDLKLLAATAAFLGVMPALYLAFLSFLIHVLWMMGSWFVHGVAWTNFRSLARWLLFLVTPRAAPVYFLPLATPDQRPHAPFIFLAALALYPLWRLGIVVP